jgi:hypothetical protein
MYDLFPENFFLFSSLWQISKDWFLSVQILDVIQTELKEKSFENSSCFFLPPLHL